MKTKEEIVKEFNTLYNNNDYAVVVDFKGLNATDTAMFRSALRTKCGSKFLVVKNTLNKVSSKGTDYEANIDFKGQCGVIFCNDLLNVAKVVDEFCFKTQKAKLVKCLNKKEIVSEEQVKELAALPSMEVLRTKLLLVLNAVGSSMVRAMVERVKKEGGEIESE